MSSSSATEPPHNDPPPAPSSDPAPRARKRRRRTMACTQCRSRKLRCDREYPICGRCQKSKTPAQCTYEDGFLWQQPNTVPATTVFSGAAAGGGPGSTIATSANSSLNSTVTRPPEINSFATNNGASNTNQDLMLPRVVADRTLVHTPDSGDNIRLGPCSGLSLGDRCTARRQARSIPRDGVGGAKGCS